MKFFVKKSADFGTDPQTCQKCWVIIGGIGLLNIKKHFKKDIIMLSPEVKI